MRDYLGLFLVLAGLLGVLTWVRFGAPKQETPSTAIETKTSTILGRPSFQKPEAKVAKVNVSKRVRKVAPSKVTAEQNSTPVVASEDTLSNGIFQDSPKAENQVTALGIPVDSYVEYQKTRFPHAKVFQEKDEKVRLFVQCWEMKDPNPDLLSSRDCEKMLSRNKRIDTSVRVY